MDQPHVAFRDLFERLNRDLGKAGRLGQCLQNFSDWTRANADAVSWLRELSQRPGNPIPPASQEELWALYALSRLFDRIIARHLEPSTIGERTQWSLPPEARDLLTAISEPFGANAVPQSSFGPFFHEIVSVTPAASDDAAAELISEDWPPLMLGPMLLLRGGAHVEAGRMVIAPQIAETATLYWTYERPNRPTHDLSHGWGANSQWRTGFRRDFLINETAYFNVDGGKPNSALDGLTELESQELLRFRQFVTCTKDGHDLFPYDLAGQQRLEAAAH